MLSAKQQRFVDEYCLDHNARRAARAAGYSERSASVTACRMLANAKVSAALALRERQMQQALDVNRETVIQGLLKAISTAKEQQNPSAMISGWTALAKLCGFYAPERHKIEMSVGDSAELQRFERMSDGELLKIMHGELTEPTK